LVTPIDWKHQKRRHEKGIDSRRQSLVTPIDWKLLHYIYETFLFYTGRQSLVTPIDWKPAWQLHATEPDTWLVANPW